MIHVYYDSLLVPAGGIGTYFHALSLHLHAIIASCHFFLSPSRSEGGPCFSVLELMQAGRLCIVSDAGGLPDLFRGHPDLGIMVPRDDHRALAAAFRDRLMRVEQGRIQPQSIRARYHEGWDMEAAHRAFMNALAPVSGVVEARRI